MQINTRTPVISGSVSQEPRIIPAEIREAVASGHEAPVDAVDSDGTPHKSHLINAPDVRSQDVHHETAPSLQAE